MPVETCWLPQPSSRAIPRSGTSTTWESRAYTLAAGETYTIAAVTGNDNYSAYEGGFVVNPQINFIQDEYVLSYDAGFPHEFGRYHRGRRVAEFSGPTSSLAAPSPNLRALLLMGIGAVGLSGFGRGAWEAPSHNCERLARSLPRDSSPGCRLSAPRRSVTPGFNFLLKLMLRQKAGLPRSAGSAAASSGTCGRRAWSGRGGRGSRRSPGRSWCGSSGRSPA